MKDLPPNYSAYNDVMFAYRMPKGSEEDRTNRDRAIQEALREAERGRNVMTNV